MTWITQAAAICSLLLHARAYVVPSKKQSLLDSFSAAIGMGVLLRAVCAPKPYKIKPCNTTLVSDQMNQPVIFHRLKNKKLEDLSAATFFNQSDYII